MQGNAQVPNYQIFWIIKHYLHRPKFLEVIFLLWPPHLGFITYQRSNPVGYLLHLLIQGHHIALFLLVSSQWRSQWGRIQGVRRDQNVDVHTLLEASLNMSLRYAYFIDKTFFVVKSKTSELGTTPLNCRIIRVCILLDIGLEIVSKKYYIHSCLY